MRSLTYVLMEKKNATQRNVINVFVIELLYGNKHIWFYKHVQMRLSYIFFPF